MSNKSQLQLNNTDLHSILSTVLGLPTQESVKRGAYVWRKLTAEGGDFVDFVVSDSESAYPDGGTQDGYWYEKVKDELPIGLMTDYAIDKFTVSSATYAMDIPHSLGKLPRAVILVKDSYPTTTTDTVVYLLGVTDGTTTNMYYYYRARRNTESTYTGGNSYFTASDTKLSYNISSRYLEGSYTLLTMA